MIKNTLKQKLNDGKTTIGPFVGLPSPGMVETMGWMGFDFVVIDCEHGPMDEKDDKCTRCGAKNSQYHGEEEITGWEDEDIESEVEEIW